MIVLNIVCDYLDVSLITLYPTLRCFVNVFWGQCLWQTGWLSHWIGCHEQRCSEGKPLQDHSRLETGHCPWCGHAAASQHVQTGRRSTKSQTSINMSSKNILVFDGTIKSYQKNHWEHIEFYGLASTVLWPPRLLRGSPIWEELSLMSRSWNRLPRLCFRLHFLNEI